MKRLFLAAFLAFVVSGEAVAAGDVMLICASSEKHYHQGQYHLLDTTNKTATFASTEPQVVGTLIIEPNLYLIKYPKTETRHETHVKINRYSGRMEFEAGQAPFNGTSNSNIFWLGVCKLSDPKRKF